MIRIVKTSSVLWATTALLGLLLSLVVAWHLLSPFSFFYSQWYDLIGIDDNIAEYGPLNRNRQGFATTSRKEHERLMAELVAAINNDGDGLADIEYFASNGEPIDVLLTDPEITHMQDVARMIHWMNLCAIVLAVLMLVLLLWAVKASMKMPSLPSLSTKMLGLLIALALIVLVIGPVKVFYQLHIWLFPDKNQWFFYYEDSLMTTMLKAPVIFGPIALILLFTALIVWWLGFSIIARYMQSIDDN